MSEPCIKFTYADEADVTYRGLNRAFRDLHPVIKLDIVNDSIKQLQRMKEALLVDIYGGR
jgi:hypothetical protein